MISTNCPVKKIIQPQMVMEGAGVLLLRSIAPLNSNFFDPFLLFDHFAFNDPGEGPIPGFPMHPHRGIQTVTYMLSGEVQHKDSLGNSGLIGPGDVQWMSAGGGILHEEMPRRGPDGSISGFQLWINLPSSQKMSRPHYQELGADSLSITGWDGCRIRVIAGEVNGVSGPVEDISAHPTYFDVLLAPEARFSLPVRSDQTVLSYVFEGHGEFGGTEIEAVRMASFGKGDNIDVRAGMQGVRFLILAGAPFGEPIFPYGPFVMNTPEEIQQALEDLRNGTFVKYPV